MPNDQERGVLQPDPQSARDSGSDALSEAANFLAQQLRERPVTVLGTAVGIGLVLGLLIGGRR